MTDMWTRTLAAVLAALLLAPAPVWSWGFDAHRLIVDRALDLLPAELKPYFEARRAFVVERSIDPDLWRTAGWAEEPPHHFLDFDWGGYGAYPFADLPREYDRAVARFGRETVHRYGTLPWRAAEFYGELRRAFAAAAESPGAGENIAFFAAVLAHYVSDAHVPFHAIVNYDGQLTNQRGVHARFESELFARRRDRLRVDPALPVAVSDPRETMFDVLLASYRLAEPLLAADKRAAAGREFYDEGYFEAFAVEAQPILERRLNEAITAVAAFIIGAWEQAGRPAVAAEMRRPPRRVPGGR